MKTSHSLFAIALSAAAIGGSAFAAPDSGPGPVPTDAAESWLTIPAIYEKVMAAGYRDINEIEREGYGYEVKAISPTGQRVKLQVDPINGELIDARSKRDERSGELFDSMREPGSDFRGNEARR